MDASFPAPSPAHIDQFEAYYEVRLPDDYRMFLSQSNGLRPTIMRCFDGPRGDYVIDRFLPLLDDPSAYGDSGVYDLEVVTSQLDARLSNGSSEFALTHIPIAALFAGGFLVFDYSRGQDAPGIGVWDHEASQEFSPVVYHICSSFSEFLALLHSGNGGSSDK